MPYSPLDKVQQLEAKLHRLIEESNVAAKAGQLKEVCCIFYHY